MLLSHLGGSKHHLFLKMWRLRHGEFSQLVLLGEAGSAGHPCHCWGCSSCGPEAGLPFPPSSPHGLVCPMPDFHYQHGSHLPGLWICLQCTICLFWWSSGKQREKRRLALKIFLWELSECGAKCVQPGSWSTEALLITARSQCLWISPGERNELTLENKQWSQWPHLCA